VSEERGKEFVAVELDNAWTVEHRAEPSGVLRFGPASLKAEFRFFIKHRCKEEGIATPAGVVRLADAEGRLWEAESVFRGLALLEKLIDLSRQQAPCWLNNAPEDWQKACAERVLLADVSDATDARDHSYFYFDSSAFYFRLKYFGIKFDIAHLAGRRLLVCITQVFGSWEGMPIEGPDGRPQATPLRPPPDEDGDDAWPGAHMHNLDSMVYEIDCRELIFCNSAYLHNEGIEGLTAWYRQSDLPLPLVFRRVEGAGEPQPAVTFQPQRSADLPHPTEVAEIDFLDGFISADDSVVELAVSGGGHLRLGPDGTRMQYHLGLAPGSATEPVDVLRCVLRLVDADGDVWQAESFFTPEVFLEAMVDVLEGQTPRCDADAGRHWPGDNAEGPVLLGVRGLLEGG
jgi:hypothetical protein